LAVAALPRFLDVTDQAKQASIEGVAGGYATAVLSARAQWEAEVRPNRTGVPNSNYVNYDGDYFWLTSSENTDFRDGYPIKWVVSGNEPTTGTAPETVTAADCADLMEQLLQNAPKVCVADDIDSTYKYLAEINGDTICKYTQLEGSTDSGHFFEYDVTKGSVTVTLQNQ
jgi:MSHA pilin protein MshB